MIVEECLVNYKSATIVQLANIIDWLVHQWELDLFQHRLHTL